MAERPQKPELQPLNSAASCPKCQKGFIVFTRPRNCQGCGKVFCKACCNYWIYLPSEFGFHTAQNVCKECFIGLSALDHSQKFEVSGPEDGLPVILLHPSAVTRRFWQPYIETLSQEGYRVYTLDFPGHGSRMDERLSVHTAHAAINEVYNNHIAPKKCAIWGHELGGYLALSYGGVNPSHCIGIIASNACGGRDAKTSELKMAAQSLLYSVKWNSTLAEKPNEILTTNTVSKDYIFQNLLRTGSYYQAWDGVLESVNVKNYLELIRSFPGKIFFLNGALTDRSAEERFLGAAQEACMEVLNEANDWFIIDDKHKDLVTDLVTKFLAKLKEKEDQPKQEAPLEDSPDSVFIHKNNFYRDEQPEEALPTLVLDKSPVQPVEPAREPQPESQPELERKSEPELLSEPQAESQPLSEPQAESQPEADSQPETSSELHSEPQAESQPEVELLSEPEAESQLLSEPEAESQPEVELLSEPQAESQLLSEPQAESQPGADSQPETSSELHSEPQAESQPEAQVESQSEPQAEVIEARGEFDEVLLDNTEPESLEDELAEAQQENGVEQLQ